MSAKKRFIPFVASGRYEADAMVIATQLFAELTDRLNNWSYLCDSNDRFEFISDGVPPKASANAAVLVNFVKKISDISLYVFTLSVEGHDKSIEIVTPLIFHLDHEYLLKDFTLEIIRLLKEAKLITG